MIAKLNTLPKLMFAANKQHKYQVLNKSLLIYDHSLKLWFCSLECDYFLQLAVVE